jgi:HK97 family phage portal protein
MLNGVIYTDEWARRLFSDSATPSGYLKVPARLEGDEPGDLRADWESAHRGGRGTAILSGGISYETISMTPEQAQFLQTRAWGVQEVARLLGIPQHFLNAGNSPGSSQSLTYTNVQAVFRELTTVTLYPTYLRRIEQAFSSLLPRGQEVQFDLGEFLKADDTTRFAALKVAIDAGIITVEEARARENLPPTVAPLPAPEEVLL